MKIQLQRGSSLVEVLVALFVLAIGLLGVLTMQTKSMQFNQSAHNYSKAVYFANDITERLRNYAELTRFESRRTLRTIAVPLDDYDPDSVPNTLPDCQQNTCSLALLVLRDLYQFQENVERLPGGRFSLEDVAGEPNTMLVTIFFDDNRFNPALDLGEAVELSEYKFKVKI